MTNMRSVLPLVLPLVLVLVAPSLSMGGDGPGPRLGVDGGRFILDGRPAFLLGASYYGGLGAPEETARRDLDGLRRLGFDWIRVWATWAAFGEDVSAVTAEGDPREPYLARLVRLVDECGRRGMVVDVTLSRGNGGTGPPRLATLAAHRKAVETVVAALRDRPNWYLDLANERNIRDPRHASFEDLRDLRETVRRLDPARLVTASHGGDMSRGEVREYILGVRVDFIAPHRPRDPRSPSLTAAKTREYREWMAAIGREVPVHYQEPFRRGYGGWGPAAADYVEDLRGAIAGGAAGWCLHQGDDRRAPGGRPRRSFDLREEGLLEQLDPVEREALRLLPGIAGRKRI